MSFYIVFYVIFLLLYPLGNLSRIPIGDIVITLNDVILPALIVSWCLYALVVEKRVLLPPKVVLVFLFGLIAMISLVAGMQYLEVSQILISALYLIRWAEYAALFLITYHYLRTSTDPQKKIHTLINYLLYIQFAFVLFGFVQLMLFPDFSKYVQHGWDPHYYRLLSSFLDPNFAGLFLVFGLVMSITPLVLGAFKQIPRILFMFLAVLSLAGIVMTFSRSSYLALVVAIGVVGLFASRKMLVVFVLFALVIFLTVPRVQTRVIGALQIDATASLRLDGYAKTFEIIKKYPVFGVGFNAFRYAQDREGYFRDPRGVNDYGGHAGAGSDSSILFLLATTGPTGLIVYLVLWGWVGIDALRLFLSKSASVDSRSLGLIFFAMLSATFVHTQFVNSIFFPWIMAWMWVLLAMMYASPDKNNVKHF